MRLTFPAILLLLHFVAAAVAQDATSALEALQLLPRPDAKRLARIEAREGNLNPARWYLLCHDPLAENGLREYVVAGGEIVALRALSQFAESVREEEVIGSETVKIDSERAARVAAQFAKANGASSLTLSYHLKRQPDAVPVWTITCADAAGKRLGEVVIDAAKGTVLSHAGFPKEPAPEKEKPRVVRTEPKPRDREVTLASATPRRIPAPPRAELVRPAPPPVAPPPPPEERGTAQKIGNSIQRLFGGGR